MWRYFFNPERGLRMSVAVAIVVVMFSAYSQNDLLLSMMGTLVGNGVDLEPVRKASESVTGDFTAKLTAAVQARLAQLVVPEVFIDVPEHPADLRKSDLEALVRPAADGFLRSYPTKDELLDQADRIRRRQERRLAVHLLFRPAIDHTPEAGLSNVDVTCELFADAFLRAVAAPAPPSEDTPCPA
jgi:hypothetical protein